MVCQFELPNGVKHVTRQSQTGELVFEGDPWAVQTLFQQLQQEIVQTYVSVATMQALQALGYSTQALDGEQGQIVIRGVAYA